MTKTAVPASGLDSQAILTIDLDALGANWRSLAARAAPADCGAAVKADAYGLGIERAVPALARAGCRTFFVAHVSEGRRARAALDANGLDGQIFVLNGFFTDAADAYRDHRLDPVIGWGDDLAAWIAARRGSDALQQRACAIHVDTGMNRLGFPIAEALELTFAAIEAAGAVLAMTHLVTAEDPDDPVNTRQIVDFASACDGPLGALPLSIANSSGVFLPQRPFHALVRPGYALYGGNPTPGRPNPMRPVVSLDARVLQVREVPAGATAGYNGRWTAKRPSRLATLGIGYADGLPIARSGGSPTVAIGGLPCPLVGRISMDLSIADVTDLPEGFAPPGGLVRLLGDAVTVDDLARACGTIGYEILVNLGRRHRRVYVGTGAD